MESYNRLFFNNCIIAEDRKNRPFVTASGNECPFCLDFKDVCVLANKYPIVTTKTLPYGIHDVVVDTPHHLEHPKDFSDAHWMQLMQVMWTRYTLLSQDEKIQFIQIFKNFGKLAGASISHSHWQIVAMDCIPQGMMRQYEAYNTYKGCYLCDKVKEKENEYVLIDDEDWLVIANETPICAYETWLVPKKHHQHFGTLNQKELKSVSRLLKKLIGAYELLEPHCAFNICMMNGGLHDARNYHFHIKLMMRLGNFAGFELATHCTINMIHPLTHVKRMKTILKE